MDFVPFSQKDLNRLFCEGHLRHLHLFLKLLLLLISLECGEQCPHEQRSVVNTTKAQEGSFWKYMRIHLWQGILIFWLEGFYSLSQGWCWTCITCIVDVQIMKSFVQIIWFTTCKDDWEMQHFLSQLTHKCNLWLKCPQ